MVHLFSRITGLLSRVASSSKIITETDAVPFLDPLTTDTTNPKPQSSPDSSNASGSASSANGDAITTLSRRGAALPGLMGFIADPLVLEARQLNEDVDAWIESLQLTTLEHERVQVGNRAYAHAMKVSPAQKISAPFNASRPRPGDRALPSLIGRRWVLVQTDIKRIG
jgi:hypothetical protein